VSHIPERELIRANRELVDYFTAEDPGPLHISVTNTNGQEESLFNARETAHLGDVRELFQGVFTIHIVALALALTAATVLLASSPVRAVAQALLYGSLYTAALVAGAGALAGIGFDDTWRQLHVFAFTNDLWELNPATDHLIQMFPRDFWFDITMLLGAFTLLQSLLIGGLSGAYLFFTRHQVEQGFLPRRPIGQRSPEPRPRIPPPRPRHIAH
jgi:integral membrane protein (TIGR01906 family)